MTAIMRLFHGNKPSALEATVGRNFDGIGAALAQALDAEGLGAAGWLVDVGCGCGRLAVQLKDRPLLRYSGYDVVPDLLDRARAITGRPDWEFDLLSSAALPLDAGQEDMVCFFSVFTHLPARDVRAYLAEARRVLKPGGLCVFSFFDPSVDAHRIMMGASKLRRWLGRIVYPLNIAFPVDQLVAWAAQAGLEVHSVVSPHPIGQSLAVLRVPA